MIIVIRISGQVGLSGKIKATLGRLRLRRKYACVLLQEEKEVMGMLEKAKTYVAFGRINKETLSELITKRGRMPGNKPLDPKKISQNMIDEIFSGEKKPSDLGLKSFFRLHPPRGGFKLTTKQTYPHGILGNWGDDINKLVKKML